MTDARDKKTRRSGSRSKRGRGRRDRRSSCEGKRKYTEAQARDVAQALQRKTTTRMVAYRCSHCTITTPAGETRPSWHVAHRVSRFRRAGG